MRYLSVCSGIEAASVAWKPFGWTAAGYSEIEPFPRAVLQARFGAEPVDWDHRYAPQSNMLPLFGDFTKIEEHHVGPIDLLVGGTPCQSFSVAGKRLGLDDPRGHLTLEYLALAKRLRPRWVVWENVPGVLSDDKGRTLGTFLRLLGQLGYRWAYRVLDAQYVRVGGFEFAVPQRRRRVFVVGHLGDDARAAAVLFDRESLRGNPAPRRQAGKGVAPTIAARTLGGGEGAGIDCADVAPTLNAAFGDKLGLEDQHINGGGNCLLPPVSMCLNAGAMGRRDAETETLIPTTGAVFDVAHAIQAGALRENPNSGPDGVGVQEGIAYTLEARSEVQAVAHALRGEGFDASEDGTGRGTPIVPVAYRTSPNCGAWETGDRVDALTTGTNQTSHIIAFSSKDYGNDAQDGLSPTLRSMGHDGSHANGGEQVAVAMPCKNSPDALGSTPEADYGVTHADAQKTGPDQALRALREAVGEEAFAEWGLGVLAAFRTPEILRSKVHGKSVRWANSGWIELGDDALPCAETGGAGAVLALWEAGCEGRSPRGWQPPEQLAGELVAHLSQLPQQRAQAARFLLGMWRASEGLGILREALSALQEAWRPARRESEPAHTSWAVRRLTPKETERLQGFPDDWTKIAWRKKPEADCPDGPRYRSIGNSMAVNVMRWIGERIAEVDQIA